MCDKVCCNVFFLPQVILALLLCLPLISSMKNAVNIVARMIDVALLGYLISYDECEPLKSVSTSTWPHIVSTLVFVLATVVAR